MEQIRLIQQIKDMARRAVERGAGRDAHHLTPGSPAAAIWQAEYDRCSADAALLEVMKPALAQRAGAALAETNSRASALAAVPT